MNKNAKTFNNILANYHVWQDKIIVFSKNDTITTGYSHEKE